MAPRLKMSLAGPTRSDRACGLLGAHIGRRAHHTHRRRIGTTVAGSRARCERLLAGRVRQSSRSNGLARPQSTTNVSSYFPSITFRGFRSR